jgi:pimeloyl-ACP methyl ester carboxylesterase
VTTHSPKLGDLNGIPVDARSRINTQVLTDDLRRVEDAAARSGVATADVLNNPAEYGLPATAITRYTNARRTQEGLVAAGAAVDERQQHPAIFLLNYQPEAFGGEGAAAIALGDPDTATHTAFLVPGLGSNVRDGSLADPAGARLYGESARAQWNTKTSVIMWVGYDAPDSWHDPGVWRPDMARTGARSLAADVNGLRATHLGTPTHLTVIGHSYGSTTAADAAAAYGMRADDVVLVGSPGTDLAQSAADFRLPATGHVYVGAASSDAVTWVPGHVNGPGLVGPTLGGLGVDPSVDGYGSTRFKAEVPGATINPVNDHSHYFDDGSESLFSIADVVSGHGDALQHDGMTTRHRGEWGLDDWVDPEAIRPATTGHCHHAPAPGQ